MKWKTAKWKTSNWSINSVLTSWGLFAEIKGLHREKSYIHYKKENNRNVTERGQLLGTREKGFLKQ